jgi:uncharacterized membrane protein YagU involved in acid resistance
MNPLTSANDPTAGSSYHAHVLGVVLIGGLIAGALDLSFAFVFYGLHGTPAVRILQFIASGILGRSSFQMGAASAALGVFCHFFIAISAAFVYFLASARISFLTRRAAVSGAIFGVLMFMAMHFIVVPLSAAKSGPLKISSLVGELCSHIFLFGMVIAFAVSRARHHHIRSSGTTKSL